MNTEKLRKLYLNYFKKEGHAIISSASLIPENDPTVLFTTAGMHPLVPYLMGEKHPAGIRLVDVQKCVRTGDIDEVGDAWHLTFFEMLGNWSLNDYWKSEAITWSFNFLTKKLGIPTAKLAVSVFEGDENAPRDNESSEIWLGLGMPKNRIAYLGKEDNWWGPAGLTGPCGPDTEMFFWTGREKPPKDYDPSDIRWVEIWNDVFMEYNEKFIANSSEPIEGEYKLERAKQRNVDTGMGLERTVAVLQGLEDVYQVDTMWPIIEKIQKISEKKYDDSAEVTKSMRIIADHIRAAVMITGDDRGVAPSNVEHGYVVRKLIRRSIRHGKFLGVNHNFCGQLASVVIDLFKKVYPEVDKNKDFVLTELEKEEREFNRTLEKGLKEFSRRTEGDISGSYAFYLFSTYGFPLEMTVELAEEKGAKVDTKGFETEFRKHQELSRSGAEQKFKGGLADHSVETTRLHTATHLLHAALREVLGKHVEQKGSNITAERLRFDFSHPAKMTDEQKRQVEDLVNAAIVRKYPMSFQEMTVDEAKSKGAIGLFPDKYEERIKVYTVGDPDGTPKADPNSNTFSMEICGGPHVKNTGELTYFKIKKEEPCSAGVRRIKAVLE